MFHLGSGRAVEKWILRKAFDDKENPYIPSEILWRQKEQFSDGVGYGWIDTLTKYCSEQVTDEEVCLLLGGLSINFALQMANSSVTFPHNTPTTKEAYFIRKIFLEHYPSQSAAESVLKWIPKWQSNTDPSGRASTVHEQSVSGRICEEAKKEVNGVNAANGLDINGNTH